MRTWCVWLLAMTVFLAACGVPGASAEVPEQNAGQPAGGGETEPPAPETVLPPEAPAGEDEVGEAAAAARQLQVQCGTATVVYALNDSAAADALCRQLPLTLTVEDYSTNEKIFYPPQALETSGTPVAEGGAGVLAYYAPWGDVVMFYGDFAANDSLYALGQVVSGGEQIGSLSGTITVSLLESGEADA